MAVIEASRLVAPHRREATQTLRLLPSLLLLPAIAIFGLLFGLPLAYLFLISLSPSGSTTVVPESLGGANYVRLVSDPFYWEILLRTLRISAMTTLVNLLVGYPVAYYLSRCGGRKRAYLMLLLVAPLMVNVVARTYGWVVVLGRQGLVNGVLVALGVFQEPVTLLFTEFAIVVGLTHIFMAYMVLSIDAALQNVDRSLLLAAQGLGANRLMTFVRVTLPLSLPGIIAGSMIVFTLSASSFITPAILGGPRNKVMSYLVYQQATFLLDWPLGAAIAFFLLVATACLILGSTKAASGGQGGRG